MKNFSKFLYEWQTTKPSREMPWKGEKDPYLVWLSEVILQQTRVEQGLKYYLTFSKKYPTIFDLANAKDDDVMKDWQGLGYYSRARNLLKTARAIVAEYNGVFPEEKEELLKLKGIGDYTVAAILSFCFNKPEAVVDGNVIRILTRYFGIYTPSDSSEGKKQIKDLAQKILPVSEPGIHNQAMMDLGALVCKPRSPLCSECPLSFDCIAFNSGQQDSFPVKRIKAKKKIRYFNYLIPKFDDYFFIRKRKEKDIWQDLYEFPYVEGDPLNSKANAEYLITDNKFYNGEVVTFKDSGLKYRQTLSHQVIFSTFHFVELKEDISVFNNDLLKVKSQKLNNFAYSKTIDWFLGQINIYL